MNALYLDKSEENEAKRVNDIIRLYWLSLEKRIRSPSVLSLGSDSSARVNVSFDFIMREMRKSYAAHTLFARGWVDVPTLNTAI